MLNTSRRSLLGSIAPAALASLVVAPSLAAATEADGRLMIDWTTLSRTTQTMVVNDYWNALTLEQKRTACAMLRANGNADMADLLMPEWSGPGVYEFRLLDSNTRPVAFLDLAAKRGADWFRWQHYFRGKFEGRGHFVRGDRLVIVRKVEGFGA